MAVSFLKGQHVNNSESTLRRLLSLYRNSTLSDVQLVVDGVIFSAHKLILSMCSDVFKTMLTDFKWPEAFKDQITLTEDPECVEVFEDFIEYMYTGHIHLSNQTVLPVVTLADKYNVRDLSDTCVAYMCANIDARGDNLQVVSWLQYARLCNYHQLELLCFHYTEWNFQKVALSNDFLSMSIVSLLEFLSSSDLVVHNEHSLFLNIKRWVLNNRAHQHLNNETQEKLLETLAGYVRFNMMEQSQLEMLLQDSLVLMYPHILGERVLDAFDFHSKQESQFSGKFEDKGGGEEGRRSGSDLPCLETLVNREAFPPSELQCRRSLDGESRLFCISPRTYAQEHFGRSNNKLSNTVQKRIRRWQDSATNSPRNYTCEDWSCQLMVENFSCLDDFAMRTFFFSTPVSNSSAKDEQACWDWEVDLYPKGVRFPRAIMIGFQENYDIDQHEHHITRIGVMANSVHGEVRNVEVSVLAKASGPSGSEYIRNVTKKKCIFDFDGCLHNLDNIVPCHELLLSESPYLTGDDHNIFEIIIIIKPLSCS